MLKLDYFSSANERWRTDAAVRARRVRVDHPDDAVDYAQRRINATKIGSFERRRWQYIKKLLLSSAGG